MVGARHPGYSSIFNHTNYAVPFVLTAWARRGKTFGSENYLTDALPFVLTGWARRGKTFHSENYLTDAVPFVLTAWARRGKTFGSENYLTDAVPLRYIWFLHLCLFDTYSQWVSLISI